jgi:hypothetical protein
MGKKLKPKIRCWIELTDPRSGRVVRRIPVEVETECREKTR